jgi:hypothetical protein
MLRDAVMLHMSWLCDDFFGWAGATDLFSPVAGEDSQPAPKLALRSV